MTALERELGLTLHVVKGVVQACPPGEWPSPDAGEHAEALLDWLRDQPPFPGNEIPASLLQQHLYPAFIKCSGWTTFEWKTVAQHFGKLRGVKARQIDRRTGWDRRGPCPRVYKIPARR